MNPIKFDMRNVPAVNYKTPEANKFWPISTRQGRSNSNAYKLYYYLLTKSAIHWAQKDCPGENRTYYFVSKGRKYWTKREAAEALGVTEKTITNNLAALVKEGLLIEYVTSYEFSELSYWISLHWHIMKSFMALEGVTDWELMIRMYSMLLYAWSRDVKTFTASEILWAAGVGSGNPNYSAAFVDMCVTWWQRLGLIDCVVHTRKNKFHEEYDLYELRRIENTPTPAVEKFCRCSEGIVRKEWSSLLGDVSQLVVDYETGEVLED